MAASLPYGQHVMVVEYGPRCMVPSMGASLIGLSIVERTTGEPLQHLSDHSKVEELIKRWDAVLSAPPRKVER